MVPNAMVDKLKLSVHGVQGYEAQDIFAALARACKAGMGGGYQYDKVVKALESTHKSVSGYTRSGIRVPVYSFDWTGENAQIIWEMLPQHYLKYMSYLHVKTYHSDVDKDAYMEFVNRATDGPMFRNTQKVSPRRESGGKKRGKLPLIRIGSNKSDVQITGYARAGQPYGRETRVKDKKLRSMWLQAERQAGASEDDGSMVKDLVVENVIREGDTLWNRLAEQCGYEVPRSIIGPVTDARDLEYYWGFVRWTTKTPDGEVVDDKGFKIAGSFVGDYQLRRIGDDVGMAFSDGTSDEKGAEIE